MAKIIYKSRYSYQKFERIQITNNIRKDLRDKLKKYSVEEINEPETKILDCMISYFLENRSNKKILTELVKKY